MDTCFEMTQVTSASYKMLSVTSTYGASLYRTRKSRVYFVWRYEICGIFAAFDIGSSQPPFDPMLSLWGILVRY